MAKAKTHKVRIKVRAFPYSVEVDGFNPTTGEPQKQSQEQLARRGDEVELREPDYQKGVRLDAFYTDADEAVQDATGEEELDVATASVEELSAWITDDKPTVPQVVDAADGDAAIAQKLLDAENHATGNSPRDGVVEGLTAIVERAGA